MLPSFDSSYQNRFDHGLRGFEYDGVELSELYWLHEISMFLLFVCWV